MLARPIADGVGLELNGAREEMIRRTGSLLDAPEAEQLVKSLVYEEADALRRTVVEISLRYPGSEDLELLAYLLGLVVQLTRPHRV
jgi:hypothetical protein